MDKTPEWTAKEIQIAEKAEALWITGKNTPDWTKEQKQHVLKVRAAVSSWKL